MDNTNEFEDYALARGLSLLIPPSPAEYSDRVTLEAWKAWQASREALVVELPDGWFDDRYGEYLATHTQIEQALSAAGIKWK